MSYEPLLDATQTLVSVQSLVQLVPVAVPNVTSDDLTDLFILTDYAQVSLANVSKSMNVIIMT